MFDVNQLVPEERAVITALQNQFGDKVQIDTKDEHVVVLKAEACGLTALPPDFAKLTQLTELSLHDNQLTALPPDFAKLTQLKQLRLNDNQLTALPPDFAKLTQLTTLRLDGNQLTALPPDFAKLTQLTQLWLHGNQLTALPPDFAKLTQLTTLWLYGNQLTALPPDFAKLTQLTQLRLDGNQLTALPPDFAKLTQLKQLWLHGNPLTDPYLELAERGIPALLEYLQSLQRDDDVVSLREARLILVGSGKVGKTQLKNALLGLPFEENAATTHGVEIDRTKQLELPCASGTPATLTIWDFGGQDTYEVTHQFFYGKRSVYLLVWHPRTPSDVGVEAWLRKLKVRLGDQARVLIVATHKHADNRAPDIDLVGLRQKFGDIILGKVYSVENNSRDEATNGIPELKRAIAEAASGLSVMGMRVNKNWLALRDGITALADTQTHVPRTTFTELATKRGLTADMATVWLNLLHDFGYLLYYGDVQGLADTIVLRPDWLTGGIARVLDDGDILATRGVLSHSRLPKLWEKYPPELHPFLHAIMEQFDICCRDKGQEWSLVGEKVPHERPANVPTTSGKQLHLVYEFDDEPPGLVPWLIVRNYRFTADMHWRLGAYLEHNGHGALIEFDRGTKRLSLCVHGSLPMNLFALLRDGIEQVLPRWEGLKDKVRRLIPCGQTKKDGKHCDRHFDLADLEAAARDDEELQCNGCRKMANVSLLLAGIGAGQEPLLDRMAELLDEKLQAQTEVFRELFAHNLRTQLRALSSVAKDAPRLFSMWPKAKEDKSWWECLDPRKLGKKTYEVWLWCEHCEQPHPVKRYEKDIASEWLVKIAPFAKAVATVLKLGVPVVGAGLGLYLDQIGASKEDKKDIKERIEQMSKLAEKCLTGDLDTNFARERITDGLTGPDGAALREFHALLRELDPKNDWGDLRPTATKEGDYLWLCAEHHKEFDPGLIQIPHGTNQ